MTRKTRKYEFTNEAAADAAIDLLRDEEGNLTEAVVKLGYLPQLLQHMMKKETNSPLR